MAASLHSRAEFGCCHGSLSISMALLFPLLRFLQMFSREGANQKEYSEHLYKTQPKPNVPETLNTVDKLLVIMRFLALPPTTTTTTTTRLYKLQTW